MAKVVNEGVTIHIPDWVTDLTAFRRWAASDDVPEEVRVGFINGEVWADMSKEEAYSHVRVKDVIGRVLGHMATEGQLGEFFGDGVRFTNEAAGVSNVPDGLFVSAKTIRAGGMRWSAGREGRCNELVGSPDLVIEVVSDSSEDKDYEWLMRAYWDAGVREYWVVDARSQSLRFDIFKAGTKGFTATRKTGGWVKSAVFGKSFRLDAIQNVFGNPDYVLRVR